MKACVNLIVFIHNIWKPPLIMTSSNTKTLAGSLVDEVFPEMNTRRS